MLRFLPKLGLLLLFPLTLFGGDHPDYVYELVGYVGNQIIAKDAKISWGEEEGDYALGGFFYMGREFTGMLNAVELLQALEEKGVISGPLKIRFETDGWHAFALLQSDGLYQILEPLSFFGENGRGQIREEFFTEATEEQRLILLKALYVRSNVAGTNAMYAEGFGLSHDRMQQLLEPYVDKMQSLRVPGDGLLVFLPNEKLKEHLGIQLVIPIEDYYKEYNSGDIFDSFVRWDLVVLKRLFDRGHLDLSSLQSLKVLRQRILDYMDYLRKEEKAQDRLYRLAGYFGDAIPVQKVWRIGSPDPFQSQTEPDFLYYFRPEEYAIMQAIFAQAQLMEEAGDIERGSKVVVDKKGRAAIHSKGMGALLDPLCDRDTRFFSHSGMAVHSNFLRESSHEQKLIYVTSLYERWGVPGRNVIDARHIRDETLRIMLAPLCVDYYTIQKEATTPGLRLVVFEPKAALKERLGITEAPQLQLGDAGISELFPEPAATAHIEVLDRLAALPDLDEQSRENLEKLRKREAESLDKASVAP